MTEFQFKDIMDGFYDGPHATPEPSDEGPVFLGIKNIHENGGIDFSNIRHISEKEFPQWTKRVVPQQNDIVFSYEATLHRYALIPEGFRGCLGRRMALIRVNKSVVNEKYLYHYFLSPTWRAFIETVKISGATVDRISISDFPNYKISLPPLHIQQKIASILSAYDELIENNKQRIKLLEEMAEEIYKEWFVRLRFPNYENTEFVDGLPKGWENGSIGSLYNVKSGFAFKSEDFGEIGYPIIKIRNIDNLEVDTINCDRYSGEINDRIKKFEIQNGDLLVAMTGATIGKVALFYTQNEPYYLNQRVGKFFNKSKVAFNQAFIYQFTKTDDFKSSVNNFALGAAQPNISGEQIENIKLLIPHSEVLASFSKLVGIMIDEIFILKSKNQLLQQTRDLLLPRLISGKLSVEGLAEAKEYVLEQNAEQWPMAAETEGEYHHS
ncbi:restriction endonuclease subunit S [Runella aurantiaca]|nr:restriction endonuclease subunit S [Runella aurantiaca]